MLNEKEIDYYFDSLKEHFINQNTYSIKLADNWLRTYSLFDNKRRLVCICKEPMTVRSLADERCRPLYSFYTHADANYELWVEKKKCWLWLQDLNTKQWTKNTNISSQEELYYYILMNQKAAFLDKIHEHVDYYRSFYTKKLYGQDYVHTLKYLEAKEILEKNITIDEFMDYPFIKKYSELKDISLQQASREVMLQNEMERGFLAESEYLRMKYTDIIRKETDIKNLKQIYADFDTENVKMSSL